MKIYTHVLISPHHAGFGMFERGEIQSGPENSWAFRSDLIHAASGNVDSVERIEDALNDPEFIALGVEDIRGRIYNEPGAVYACIEDGELRYFGVEESEVEENFFA